MCFLYKKLYLLPVLLVVMFFCEPSFAQTPMPSATITQVTILPIQWCDDPQHLEENQIYELIGLFLVDSPSTRVGTIYGAHNKNRIFFKIILDTGYIYDPGTLRNSIDWDRDGYKDHMTEGAIVADDNSIWLNIGKTHAEGDIFDIIFELLAMPGNLKVQAPFDLGGKIEVEIGGDDSVGGS